MRLRQKRVLRQNKGFTLIELILAIGLLSLVSLLTLTLTISVDRFQNASFRSMHAETEFIEVSTEIKNWLMSYDKQANTIMGTQNKIEIISDGQIVATMIFEGNKLNFIDVSTKSISFTSIKSVNFSLSGQIIKCSIIFDDGDFNVLKLMSAAKVNGENYDKTCNKYR